MLTLDNHRLAGPGVTHRDTPNRGGLLQPRFLVMHYTAGRSAASSVESLCNPQSKASAHLVVARDGSITQLLPFNVVAWHAGVSQWNGLVGMNQHAIGIEFDNAGLLKQVGERYVAWFGLAYPPDEVLLAEHRHGGGVKPWHTFTAEQIDRAVELATLLVSRYGLEDVLGHEDVARGRKTDPGPAFPLAAVAGRALGRVQDEPPHYTVTAASLNVRGGPGVQFPIVAAPLKRGAELLLLEPGDRWSRVEWLGDSDVEGWVNNLFIAPLPAALARPAGPQAAGRKPASRPGAKAAAKRASKPTTKQRAAKR
jgi:N-acetylmuramoyl-L-alanine amidase